MKKKPDGFSRRDFLRTSALAGAGLALPFVLPESLQAAVAAQTAALAKPASPDFPILVVLELGGGNDGLNTVVPVGADPYFRARPTLALKRNGTLPLDDQLGLHSSLKELKSLYEEGRLSIINGVGYPNPDRSHFRSMEIWRTASGAERHVPEGWLGRYLDTAGGDHPDPLSGIAVGPELPQSLCGDRGAGIAFQEPRLFRWMEGRAGDTEAAFQRLNHIDGQLVDDTDTLGFLRNITTRLVLSSDRVRKVASRTLQGVDYPQGRLGRDLKIVADCILADLPTRVYSVSLVGFDTHANQAVVQANLLRQFSQATHAFFTDLRNHRVSDRVLVLCYSEFGRRVEENASRGTDHGTAGPMFLLGNPVRPGLHGRYPSLEDLDGGDLKYQVDFRSVYATLLENWFGAESARVLPGTFPKLNLLKT